MKKFEIWAEGYASTCEYGIAIKIGEGFGNTFDEAVQDRGIENQ